MIGAFIGAAVYTAQCNQRAFTETADSGTRIKGEPVDPAKTYRMATLNFNATGGDGYPRLDNKPGYVNTGFIDAEVLKAYIQKSTAHRGGWFQYL